MTYDQLIQIERTANKAFRAARVFADRNTWELLEQAEYLLAEIRHCGEFLCDGDADMLDKSLVKDRLMNIFNKGN